MEEPRTLLRGPFRTKYLASAPGAADIIRLPNVPKLRLEEDPLREGGGGVKLWGSMPTGPGEAATVPRAP